MVRIFNLVELPLDLYCLHFQDAIFNKLKGSAEEKANKKAAGLKEQATKAKDAAKNLRNAKTSAGQLVGEFETILATLAEIGAGVVAADLQSRAWGHRNPI